MSLPRAYAFRVDLPREPGIVEADLPDLTSAAGPLTEDALHIAPPKALWTKVPKPVPGTLITGTLPPENRARFLLRVPSDWNGRLVVGAASGITDESTYDLYFSDFLLSKGYAFAATDKGVRRALLDGDTVVMPMTPESSVRRWAGRLETLVETARELILRRHGSSPERVYAVGLSNGGFIARRAAEIGFVDGAVDISGVMWRADKGNLLRELPALLRAVSKEPWDQDAIARASFPRVDAKWKPLADLYKLVYWESSLGIFLSDLDPTYAGAPADYDLDSRPAALAAIREFENTGDLKAPLISIAGRHDYLIPCAGHAEAYRDLVRSRGKADLHRLLFEDDAAHIDTNADMFPFVTPLMPRAHAAFDELVTWVEN
ncbi:MAG: tannase/feruloyl esterase family alpha/beta hydrolase [Elusimicrobiota bacterium]|nr:tannase/feruloyl esterase family alpha/beta hydrolase [Elusimicrobiota bacterium]